MPGTWQNTIIAIAWWIWQTGASTPKPKTILSDYQGTPSNARKRRPAAVVVVVNVASADDIDDGRQGPQHAYA